MNNNINNKRIIDQSFDISTILKKLKNYELSSHIDVILLGSKFQNIHIKEIENNLEQMSQLSSINNFMSYIKEKIIFHVSLAKHLEQSIINLDSCDTFLNILQQYHVKSASHTVLYVLSLEDNLSLTYCLQDTFISKDGFAYLNLNLIDQKQIINSNSLGIHQFPSKIKWKDGKNSKFELTQLSMLIYRSIEQLIPFTQPNSNNNNNKIYHHIQAHIFQLCGYPLGKCNPDGYLPSTLDTISNHIKNTNQISINYSSSVLRIVDSLSLTNAIFSSITKYSTYFNSFTKQQKRQILLFSPSELIDELKKTQEVQNILNNNNNGNNNNNNDHKLKTLTLSFFSLTLSDDFDGLFLPSNNNNNNNNNNNTMIDWYQSPILISELSSHYSLGILRPTIKNTITRGVLDNSLVYNTPLYHSLQSNENILRDIEYDKREIFDKILELIWNISPTTLHYSSSQQIINDYLWFNSFKHSIETFRDSRVIQRNIIVQNTEKLLKKFSTGLTYTNLNLYKNEFPENHHIFLKEFKYILQQFDDIASSYSHLEYNSAIQSILNIENKLLELEKYYLNHHDYIYSKTIISTQLTKQQQQQQLYLSCQMNEINSSEINISSSYFEMYLKSSAWAIGLIFGFLLVLSYFRVFSFDSKRSMRRVTR